MVDARALRFGAVVAGGLLALFVASALFWLVTRWLSRILTWSVLLVLVVAVGYAVYQLYSGWSDAGASVDAGATAEGPADVESVQERYTSGELTEAELEAELEEAVGGPGSDDREPERES